MQLSTFQDGLAAALMPQGPHPADTAPWLSALRSQPGFAVYRNTVHKACIDALQANYPTVCALVGEEWFRAAAGLFVHARPPTDGRLMAYGEGFAHFLQGFEAAAGLPYLPAVARLDRCWTESHLAADSPLLDAAWLARQSPEALSGLRLAPHPAARWAWSEEHPASTLWQRQREGTPLDAELQWQGDGALLTRPEGGVQWMPLARAGIAFLDACAAALPLELAAAHARQAEPGADLGALMAQLLQAGALCAPPHLDEDNP